MSKQYGLIKPDKSKKETTKVKNIFGDSSSDEDAPVKKPRTIDSSAVLKKQAIKLQQEALAEDPNIFQYDEVYDEMEQKRKEEKLAKKTSDAKTPKYIAKLLETADKRKKEHERRIERQVQKEREAEGNMYKDKESFVTSSYRKKLEEMKEAEKAEEREAYLENIGDVTKQQDLSGFYRHIYEQKMAPEDANKSKSKIAADPVSAESGKKKNYRKRKSSADLNDDESDKDEVSETAQNANDKKAHLSCNLDADSDFSIDSSSSEDENDKKETNKIQKQEPATLKEEKVSADMKNEENEPELKKEDEAEQELAEPKQKIDIWKKRTVGEVFDEALQRYFQRKAERERGTF
ncbi:CLUMA_CG011427, isoform A [Clunio marinus]|uniref:CLUMA_CG011427, isoform A n=1 Tax=Clunio marinus TaxID=568069 RepID=A0A1J1IE62_9DIPT|nr:CLUMA_CG011427, isoform A [Clunio marinus]